MSKKDLGLIGINFIMGSAIIAQVLYIYSNNINITSNTNTYNLIILLVSFILGIIILTLSIFRVCLNKSRLSKLGFGIFLILFAYYSGIIDYPKNTNMVFLKDLLMFIGTLMIIFSTSKFFEYDKCKKEEEKKQEAEMEIIEV